MDSHANRPRAYGVTFHWLLLAFQASGLILPHAANVLLGWVRLQQECSSDSSTNDDGGGARA